MPANEWQHLVYSKNDLRCFEANLNMLFGEGNVGAPGVKVGYEYCENNDVRTLKNI